MDLVDEQDVAVLHGREQTGEVAGLFDDGSAGGLDVRALFVRDDVGKRGLAESGGTVEQKVSERFVALFGGFDVDFEAFLDAVLTGKLLEFLRTESLLDRFVPAVQRRGDVTFGFSHFRSTSGCSS